jgi:phenylpyruvate tautomerase PptA (4-oxalocrotonate tautomerase family)
MDTGTDHIAVTLRCLGADDLVFGRAAPGGRIAFLNADLRNGRTAAQKRQLALGLIADLGSLLRVPPENTYVIYTEHDGANFQLHDRVLPSWSEGEDPLA